MEYKDQPLHASASEAITNNVRVEVESQFVPDRSQPFEQLWHFIYTVRITNEGDDNVQLLSRHWIITDATGHTQEVRGPGVVGEQPLLHPGESFQYTSNCELSTSMKMGQLGSSPVPGRLMPMFAARDSPGPFTMQPMTASVIDSTPSYRVFQTGICSRM